MTLTSATSPPLRTDILRIEAWPDPLVEQLGHDPRSAYVEQFWLGVLGPSTVWWLRHCAAHLDEDPAGFELDLGVTAAALGLGHQGGRNSPLSRAVARACRFGAARPAGSATVQVRRRIPPLTRAQIKRLPDRLQHRHEAFLERELGGDPASQQRRARRLALGLMECGDGVEDTELQLGQWRFHPSVAADAVRWAWAQHAGN